MQNDAALRNHPPRLNSSNCGNNIIAAVGLNQCDFKINKRIDNQSGANMNQNITMSENINELLCALSKAQGKIQPACKDKSNPFFKSKYADLSSVWDACRDYLSDNGLSVIQLPQTKEEGLYLTSILGHSSGQWIKSDVFIPLAKNDPQSIGSALTYFRRYSLSAIVGIAPEDDDGEKAQSGFRQKDIKKLSETEVNELEKLLEKCDSKYKEWLFQQIQSNHNTKNLRDLPSDVYSKLYDPIFKNCQSYQEKLRREQQLLTLEA